MVEILAGVDMTGSIWEQLSLLVQAVGLVAICGAVWLIASLKGDIALTRQMMETVKQEGVKNYKDHTEELVELNKIVTQLINLGAQHTTTMAIFEERMKDLHRRLRAIERGSNEITDS